MTNVCRKWANSWFPITRLCFNHKFNRNQGSEIRIYLVETKKKSRQFVTKSRTTQENVFFLTCSVILSLSITFVIFISTHCTLCTATIEDTFWLTASRQIVISYNQSSDITERIEIILFEYVILTAWYVMKFKFMICLNYLWLQ